MDLGVVKELTIYIMELRETKSQLFQNHHSTNYWEDVEQ